MTRLPLSFRVAHASRVLAMASPPSRTFCRSRARGKDRFGGTPKPARETRALPGAIIRAFTIIELLIVMSVIIVLAGLVIATSGYVQEKSKRSRAEAEIAAMSAALESYKADNGIYPRDTAATDTVNPATLPVPNTASRFLYGELSGDRDLDGTTDANLRSYMTFKPASLKRANMSQPISSGNPVTAIRDPFGDSYGYSTMRATAPTGTGGYNPTFDLWSAAGSTDLNQAKWIKNW